MPANDKPKTDRGSKTVVENIYEQYVVSSKKWLDTYKTAMKDIEPKDEGKP